MRKLIAKSLVFGFTAGTLFFALTPLGLGVALVEFLRPILAPGIALLQFFWQTPAGPAALILGLGLNGLIYSMLFLCFLAASKYVVDARTKILATVLVTVAFLAATGMLSNVLLLLNAADRSWIFQVGA